MPRGRRGAVHLVLGVQREHDVQRARQPRVRPVAARPRTSGFSTVHSLMSNANTAGKLQCLFLCAAPPYYLWHPHAACPHVCAHREHVCINILAYSNNTACTLHAPIASYGNSSCTASCTHAIHAMASSAHSKPCRVGLSRALGVAPASSMYRKFSAYDSRWLGCAAARPLARWYASAAIAGILPVHAQQHEQPSGFLCTMCGINGVCVEARQCRGL